MSKKLMVGWMIVFSILVLISQVVHAVDRQYLKTEEILNEASTKKPGTVQIKRRAVTTATSVALTDLSNVNEVYIQNKYDTNLCIVVALPGETCTAVCTGNFFKLGQDEGITLPLPKGTSSNSGVSASYGSYCGIMQTSPTNSEAVQTVERN